MIHSSMPPAGLRLDQSRDAPPRRTDGTESFAGRVFEVHAGRLPPSRTVTAADATTGACMWRHTLARLIAAACAVFRCRALRECAITPADTRPFAQLLSPRDVTCPRTVIRGSSGGPWPHTSRRPQLADESRDNSASLLCRPWTCEVVLGVEATSCPDAQQPPEFSGPPVLAPHSSDLVSWQTGGANESDRAIGAGYRCRKRSAHRAAAIVVDRARAARMIASRVAVSTER